MTDVEEYYETLVGSYGTETYAANLVREIRNIGFLGGSYMKCFGKRTCLAVLLAAVVGLTPSCGKKKGLSNSTPGEYDLSIYSYTELEDDVYVIDQLEDFGLEISEIEKYSMQDYVEERSYIGLRIRLSKCERELEAEALFYEPGKSKYTHDNADVVLQKEMRKGADTLACFADGEGTVLPFEDGYDMILVIDDVPVLYALDVHREDGMQECAMKPVIYLYPEEPVEVNVKLDFDGELTCTYPEYKEDGWNVLAYPDGKLVDEASGRSYDYLFWEGEIRHAEWDRSGYFCVAGTETAAFLEEYLEAVGLNDSEIDDFISFWLPRMQENPYNLIYFQTSAYEKIAELTIDPVPDTLIRVYMVFKPSYENVGSTGTLPETPSRDGFTIVEWGGSEMRKIE